MEMGCYYRPRLSEVARNCPHCSGNRLWLVVQPDTQLFINHVRKSPPWRPKRARSWPVSTSLSMAAWGSG